LNRPALSFYGDSDGDGVYNGFDCQPFNSRKQGPGHELSPEQKKVYMEIRESLTPDIVADPNVTKYKTIPELLIGHINLAKMISAKGVIIPKEGAPQEEVDKYLNALGRPEKADGYKFTPVEKLHASIKITPESEEWFRGVAHKAGLTQEQADIINKEYLGSISTMLAAKDKEWNDDASAADLVLKNEWGTTNYDKNFALAKKFIKSGGEQFLKDLGEAQNKPSVIKFFAKKGMELSEDDIHIPAGGTPPANTDAVAKIKAIHTDRTHPYWNEKDPKHFEAVEEMVKLYESAYPEKGAE
jgi:hypothetical protein